MRLQSLILNLMIALAVIMAVPDIYANAHTDHDLKILKIKEITSASLNYLSEKQQKETIGIKRFKGEWKSKILLDWTFPFLGFRGKNGYDSNLFTTTTIYNILAKILLAYPDEHSNEIIPMLNLAIPNIALYKNKETQTFGFWQFFPRRPHTYNAEDKLKVAAGNPPLTRRTNNFDYYFNRINYAENVPDDTDDTATAYTAFKYHQILGEKFSAIENYNIPVTSVGPLFETYRDNGRSAIRNPFNIPARGFHNSGAFLTWYQDDRNFNFYDIAPHRNKVFLPFGLNDVDCVVNANILRSLALYGELSTTKGSEESCNYLKKMIDEKKYYVCGMYYPNPNTFFYSTAKAYESGASCLKPALGKMVHYITKHQRTGGHWHSYERINRNHDTINSTAYAVSALSILYQTLPEDERDKKMLSAIKKGVDYLLKKAIWTNEKRHVHWPAGVSFSGGTLIRYAVIWTSEAQTTALAIDALSNYRKVLDHTPQMELQK